MFGCVCVFLFIFTRMFSIVSRKCYHYYYCYLSDIMKTRNVPNEVCKVLASHNLKMDTFLYINDNSYENN